MIYSGYEDGTMTDIYFDPLTPRARLKPNTENPKLITEASVDKMADLLQTHGFRDPVEARHEDGRVLAGHRRLLAADKLGLTLIPTVFHVGMNDDEATAYTISHTQAESDVDWNRALLADQLSGLPAHLSPDRLGFSEKEIAKLFDLDRAFQDDGEVEQGVGGGEAGGGVSGLQAAVPAGLRPGERWIIGPVTFNVFKNLSNQGLREAEMLIRKIMRMLKAKAYLDGDDTQPLDVVLKQRAEGP